MKNLIVAFILNLSFAVFEFLGGVFSGSIAITSDALHDLGDALTIGISVFLERKSKKPADENYNFGYGRFSLLGGFITNTILLSGSLLMISNGIHRLLNPIAVNTDLTLIFAILGFIINFFATVFTRHGHSHNHKAINLHMLEDLLGWLSVLAGAIIMKFTNLTFIDPLLSIIISAFIFVTALKEIKEILPFFLLKCPVSYKEVENALEKFNYSDLKIFAIDEFNICASLQIYDNSTYYLKHIEELLLPFGITKVIIEHKNIDASKHLNV